MKRAATAVAVVAVAMILGSSSAALASHGTAVTPVSVSLAAGGSVVVQGNVDCTAGYQYIVSTTVRQRSGKQYNTAYDSFFGSTGTCSATGPQSYTTGPLFGQGPFHPGPATVQNSATVCDSFSWFSDCAYASGLRDVKIGA